MTRKDQDMLQVCLFRADGEAADTREDAEAIVARFGGTIEQEEDAEMGLWSANLPIRYVHRLEQTGELDLVCGRGSLYAEMP